MRSTARKLNRRPLFDVLPEECPHKPQYFSYQWGSYRKKSFFRISHERILIRYSKGSFEDHTWKDPTLQRGSFDCKGSFEDLTGQDRVEASYRKESFEDLTRKDALRTLEVRLLSNRSFLEDPYIIVNLDTIRMLLLCHVCSFYFILLILQRIHNNAGSSF